MAKQCFRTVSFFFKFGPFHSIFYDEYNKVNKHMSEPDEGQTHSCLRAFPFFLFIFFGILY